MLCKYLIIASTQNPINVNFTAPTTFSYISICSPMFSFKYMNTSFDSWYINQLIVFSCCSISFLWQHDIMCMSTFFKKRKTLSKNSATLGLSSVISVVLMAGSIKLLLWLACVCVCVCGHFSTVKNKETCEDFGGNGSTSYPSPCCVLGPTSSCWLHLFPPYWSHFLFPVILLCVAYVLVLSFLPTGCGHRIFCTTLQFVTI